MSSQDDLLCSENIDLAVFHLICSRLVTEVGREILQRISGEFIEGGYSYQTIDTLCGNLSFRHTRAERRCRFDGIG